MMLLNASQITGRVAVFSYSLRSYMVAEESLLENQLLFPSRHF